MRNDTAQLRETCIREVAQVVADDTVVQFLADELIAGYNRLAEPNPSVDRSPSQLALTVLANSFTSVGTDRSHLFMAFFARRQRHEFDDWNQAVDAWVEEINEQLGQRWRIVAVDDPARYRLAYRVARGQWETIPREGLAEIVMKLPD